MLNLFVDGLVEKAHLFNDVLYDSAFILKADIKSSGSVAMSLAPGGILVVSLSNWSETTLPTFIHLIVKPNDPLIVPLVAVPPHFQNMAYFYPLFR